MNPLSLWLHGLYHTHKNTYKLGNVWVLRELECYLVLENIFKNTIFYLFFVVYLRTECGLYKLKAIPARLLCPKCKGNLLKDFKEVQTKL